MERVLIGIRRGLTVFVVLLFVFWAAMQWGTRLSAADYANGIVNDADGTATAQMRWMCNAAAGPDCLLLDQMDQSTTASK